MTHKYLYTRDGDKEQVLHIGVTGTLVGFRGDPGIAAALAEMKKANGQTAFAKELSAGDFEKAKELAEKEWQEFEASQPKISFEL